MTFRDGTLYTATRLSPSDPYWRDVVDAVQRRTKPNTGTFTVQEVYSLRWRNKPFPYSYTYEFRPNRRFFWHGSSIQNLQRILDEGFKPGMGGMLGPGIYTTFHINKSWGYAPERFVMSVMIYAPNTVCFHSGDVVDLNSVSYLKQAHDAIEVRSGVMVGTWSMNNHEICVQESVRAIPRFITKLTHKP
ncbi:MAG: hypothetical protein AB7R89_27375 [Dehalococcoidia bacterium]